MTQTSSAHVRVRMDSSRASDSSLNDESRSAVEIDPHVRRKPNTTGPTATSMSSNGQRAPSIPRSVTDPRLAAIGKRRQSIREQNTAAVRSARSGSGSVHSGKSSIDLTTDSIKNVSASGPDSRTTPSTPNMNIPGKHHMKKPSSEYTEFLAPINFDDFHNSILDEPSLNNFPLPGHGGAGYDSNNKILARPTKQSYGADAPTTRTTRSNSIRRQSDVSRLQTQTTSAKTSMPPPPPPSAKSRRQSHVPSSSVNVSSRAPRKSVGPGILTTNPATDAMPKRRPSLSMRKPSIDTNKGDSHLRFRSAAKNDSESLGAANSRALKTKSLQPPSRERSSNDSLPTPTNDDRSLATSGLLTPMRTAATAAISATTPSSSSASKRMSTMPHATGLGARTISPTDARRMKRVSMMPQAPPVPLTSPTTQSLPIETLSLQPRPSQSPSMIPRKSVTPSSSRTTPDPSRKSFSSGISLSSNTSHNSARNSNGSLQPRLSQLFPSSRLPTPKPRMEAMSNETEEEVPPVPAIPKAYESPKTECELVFPTSARKSSLPLEIELTRSSNSSRPFTTVKGTTESFAPTGPWTAGSKISDTREKQAAAIARKSLQPLKLPPLNLLPLSIPMAAKIDALHNDYHQMPSTPPPQSNIPKTPSTPMTASKASFPKDDDDDVDRTRLPRSNTSHFLVSTSNNMAGSRAPSSSSAVGPLEMPSFSRNMSPYISSSLPKSGSDFNFMRQHLSGEYSNSQLSTKLMGPRPQTQSSSFSVNPEAGYRLSRTPDADASGATPRNKLPSTLRHSVSKPILSSDTKASAAKYDSMPPPRLPASATWNGLSAVAARTTSPSSKGSFLSNSRKASLSSLNLKPSSLTNEPNGYNLLSPDLTGSGGSDAPDDLRSPPIASPAQRPMAPARSNAGTKSRIAEPPVDQVEAAADEEMRRLGSKRKDFEVAAKELDELRRRASPKERVSPAQALKMASLNIFERGEIIDFKDIYFCGTQKAKKHVGDLKSQAANFGYDDDRGDYQIIIGDHLAYRYEVVDVLGKGSFGQVVRCVDHKTGQLVAVKIIRNKKRFHQQALVEVNILQKLKEWDPNQKHSVVHFTQSFYFRGHLCISTELLGMNLYEFIKAHNFKGFSLRLIRQFTKQMLSTLVLLHSKRVIHCDLKPENILLAHPMRSEIKVIDFGSSCFDHEKVYTYIQSRFYRSPEVILGMSYGMAIDMWSLGCILAELYTGYPIFPGENEQEQLACIMEIFGPPEKHLIDKSTRRKLFFDSLGKPRLTVSSKGRRRRPSSKDLRQSLKCDDEPFLDFISRCLRWDPARRMNPNDAMNHEFITGVKPLTRPRAYVSSSSQNPVSKRLTTNGVSSIRPLPEPPGMGSKPGLGFHKATSSSPVKPGAKRLSSVNNSMQQQSTASKRISNSGLPSNSAGSALPRRDTSGNIAAAAAAMSLAHR